MLSRYVLLLNVLAALLLASTTPRLHAQDLNVYMTASSDVVAPGDRLTYTLVVSNTGDTDLSAVSVPVQLPEFVSRVVPAGEGFRHVSSGSLYAWEIDVLVPDQTRTLSYTATLNANAPRGAVLRSRVLATATGSRQSTLQEDVLTGELLDLCAPPPPPPNQPPTAAVITSPEDEAVFDCTEKEDSTFTVTWTPSVDPEGDPLTYNWEVSEEETFSEVILDKPSVENGTATRFDINCDDLRDSIAGDTDASGSLMAYHRVVTRDGTNRVPSDSLSITFRVVLALEQEPGLPDVFALHGNYPNPFNPTTTFCFDLPQPAYVTLTVYDAVGREVATIVSEQLTAGSFRYTWEAGNLPSGVYFYRLDAGSYTSTKKLVLLK